jgi:outer membrane protein assembly factor BamB
MTDRFKVLVRQQFLPAAAASAVLWGLFLGLPETSWTASFKPSHTFGNPVPSHRELFGQSVALSGNRVLVGAIGDDEEDAKRGPDREMDEAYLFDTTTGELQYTFVNPSPPDGNPLTDRFGFAVALNRNYAAVSAPSDDEGAIDSGAVYLFDPETGRLQRSLFNPNPGDDNQFGGAVALSGDRVLVGTPQADAGASNSGAAYLFDAKTGELLQTFTNPAPGAGDLFGNAVAIDGDSILIGAFLDDAGDDNENIGAAYLFDAKTGELKQAFLDPNPSEGDLFGSGVAISGNRILVSSRSQNADGSNRGVVYLFDLNTGDLLQTFINPTPDRGEVFGLSIALYGDVVAIGASANDGGLENNGAAYVFDAVTGNLMQTFFNPAPAKGDLFGNAVAMDSSGLLIGAVGDDGVGENTGSVYLYEVLPSAQQWSR